MKNKWIFCTKNIVIENWVKSRIKRFESNIETDYMLRNEKYYINITILLSTKRSRDQLNNQKKC